MEGAFAFADVLGEHDGDAWLAVDAAAPECHFAVARGRDGLCRFWGLPRIPRGPMAAHRPGCEVMPPAGRNAGHRHA